MGGPAKTPTAVLKARGAWRAKGRENAPSPPPGRPVCPRWLCPDAKEIWKQIVPQLYEMGVLTRLDRNALARYCALFVRWEKDSLWLRENGETFTILNDAGEEKYTQQHPLVGIVNKLGVQLGRLEQQFGMTPASRANIKIAPPPTASKSKTRFFPDNQAG